MTQHTSHTSGTHLTPTLPTPTPTPLPQRIPDPIPMPVELLRWLSDLPPKRRGIEYDIAESNLRRIMLHGFVE